MPKYNYSTDVNDSSYESDSGTIYSPAKTTQYRLTKFNPNKPFSSRCIQIQLISEGINYFLVTKTEIQSGCITFEELPPNLEQLKKISDENVWFTILRENAFEIIDIILKKGHGIKGYLATGTYSLARTFESTSSLPSSKSKVILNPINCDFNESRRKYRFFNGLYPKSSFYDEDVQQHTYRLALPYIAGTLYGDIHSLSNHKDQIKLFLATVKSLQNCHAKRIICLDLNPYNIKYIPSSDEHHIGTSFLIDGGFSNESDERIAAPFFQCETLEKLHQKKKDCHYIAPECWYIKDVDTPPLANANMDVYSMGQILSNILRAPFSELSSLIESCCRKDPNTRILLAELEPALEDMLHTYNKQSVLNY